MVKFIMNRLTSLTSNNKAALKISTRSKLDSLSAHQPDTNAALI